MIAGFYDVAVLHVEDQVGIGDGGQAVRDDKRRPPAQQVLHRLADLDLGAGVDRGGRLVQDQHGGVAAEDARDREQLPLPDRDLFGVAVEWGVVSPRQGADEKIRARRLCGGDDLLARRVGSAVGNVVGDRPLKEARILEHHAEGAAQVGTGHLADVPAVQQDLAAVRVVEAHQQVDKRGLARAGAAHHGDLLSGQRAEVHVLHQAFFFRVAEAHMPEFHLAAHLAGNIRCGRLGRELRLVEQPVDPLERGERRLHGVGHIRDLGQRLRRLPDVLEERLKNAHAYPAAQQHCAAEHGEQHLTHAVDEADGGVDRIDHEVRLAGCLRQLFRCAVQRGGRRILAAECLDDGAPGVVLLHHCRHRADTCLPPFGGAERHIRYLLRGKDRDRRKGEEHERQPHIEIEHHGDRADDHPGGGKQLQNAGLHRFGRLVEVVGHMREDRARLVFVKEGKRQAVQFVGDGAAQAVADVLGKACHEKAL